ncbi:hypothetical protein BOTBODRAFT_57004 [Botryobasidium botryosum FD-172 SS1]|uniref:C2H2-type domain-containing protein n=1 Tax=Botryobasidium botryosum (strain FD-172 SS1) TaxID=930990 RepID=A0A067MBS8_BOTB1|nr:hypothetical protein BOTBODRAFT_57004 [Botryobasidium botryosum FD-172 SS1]
MPKAPRTSKNNAIPFPRPIGTYPCTIEGCVKIFTRKYDVTRHEKQVHSGSRPYRCDQCAYAYKQESGLKDHLRTHTIDKLSCSSCKYKTADGTSLSKHWSTNHGVCGLPGCPFHFPNQKKLDNHRMKVHGFAAPAPLLPTPADTPILDTLGDFRTHTRLATLRRRKYLSSFAIHSFLHTCRPGSLMASVAPPCPLRPLITMKPRP